MVVNKLWGFFFKSLAFFATYNKTWSYLLVVLAGNYGRDVSFDAILIYVNKTKISLHVNLFSED